MGDVFRSRVCSVPRCLIPKMPLSKSRLQCCVHSGILWCRESCVEMMQEVGKRVADEAQALGRHGL